MYSELERLGIGRAVSETGGGRTKRYLGELVVLRNDAHGSVQHKDHAVRMQTYLRVR